MGIVQIFCTANQVIEDLKLRGFEDTLLDRIKEASDTIRRKGGLFIPVSETRKYGKDPSRADEPLYVDHLLAVTGTITNDGVAVTDYTLYPLNKCWENGPYIQIAQDGNWADEDGIEIPGRWGKYEENAALGLSGTQATAVITSLAVTNGSLVSPGMILKIGDEQEYVTEGNGSKNRQAATAATSLVNGSIYEADSSITVDDGSEFNAGEVIQIDVEDMKILKVNGNMLAVERGWNGTTPADHANDEGIGVYRTFTVVRGVNGTTAAAHTSADIYQCKVPESVNYLCRQIAALMRMKAMSGFTGITGNAEGGQGTYYSEFPRNQIDAVLAPFKVWDD
jgi:hypothetical protein